MHFLLQIFTCGFPPLEDRDISLQVLSGHDFFGGGTFTKEETVSLLLPSSNLLFNSHMYFYWYRHSIKIKHPLPMQ